jgi:hypothetical protein
LWALGGCATAELSGGDGSVPDAGTFTVADAGPALDAPVTPDGAPSPDAPPMSPDATPTTTPDAAPPPPPDACVPSVVDLLVNGSFDDGHGVGWVEFSSGGFDLVVHESEIAPFPAQSPEHVAWLGGYPDAIDSLQQEITVPPDATSFQVTGFRLIVTEEASGPSAIEFDVAWIVLRDSSGALLEILKDTSTSACVLEDCTWSNRHASSTFQQFTLTPTGNYAGQTIRIQLLASLDAILHTNFVLDSLQVRVTACP